MVHTCWKYSYKLSEPARVYIVEGNMTPGAKPHDEHANPMHESSTQEDRGVRSEARVVSHMEPGL